MTFCCCWNPCDALDFGPCYVSSCYLFLVGVKNLSPYSAMMMVLKILLLKLVSVYDLAMRFALDRSDPQLQWLPGVPAKSVVFYYKFLTQHFFV